MKLAVSVVLVVAVVVCWSTAAFALESERTTEARLNMVLRGKSKVLVEPEDTWQRNTQVAQESAEAIVNALEPFEIWSRAHRVIHGQKEWDAEESRLKAVAMGLEHLIFQSGTAAQLLGCRHTPLNDIDAWSQKGMTYKGKNVLRIEEADVNGAGHVAKDNVWEKGNGNHPVVDPTKPDTAVHAGNPLYAGHNEMDVWTVHANYWGHGETAGIRDRVDHGHVRKLKFTVDGVERTFTTLSCQDMIKMKFAQVSTRKRQTYGNNGHKFTNDASDIFCMCSKSPACATEDFDDETKKICRGKWLRISNWAGNAASYAAWVAMGGTEPAQSTAGTDIITNRWWPAV